MYSSKYLDLKNKAKNTIKSYILMIKQGRFNRYLNRYFSIAIVVVLIIGMIIGSYFKAQYDKSIAYNIIFKGNNIGIVKNENTIKKIIDEIEKELSKDYGLQVVIKDNIKLEEIHAEDDELLTQGVLKNNIKSKLSFNVYAYELKIDGKTQGILKSKELAEKIIEQTKKIYIDESKDEKTKIEDVQILEDVKINKVEVPITEVGEYDKILKIIQRGTDEEKTHIVQKGESFWSIAHKYNIPLKDLIKANHDKNPSLIQPGDELSLIVPKPYLSVCTYEKKKFIEKVKFDTKYEYSSRYYKDEVRVGRKGVYGKKEIVANVKKVNGVEVAKEVIKETLISQPIAQILLKGTKDIPPCKGTGRFMTPTQGRLTSPYGPRWGGFHYGIDLATRTGTPIKAADGGVVTFAGWNGNYGYMVEIDHGGGFSTRYGHCSKIYVKKGQKVYKDKTIAAVGSTGRSTGPHVHFEVRKYGKPVNPYNYIGKKYR